MFTQFVKAVTGKKLLQPNFCSSAKTQDANNIYAYDISEAVHEVCHYIFATPEQRKMPNLGWENYNEKDIPTDLVIQEIKACLYTKVLIENLLEKKIINFSSLTKRSIEYAEYLINASDNLAKKNSVNVIVMDEEKQKIKELIDNFVFRYQTELKEYH